MLERPGATSYVDRYEWEQKRNYHRHQATIHTIEAIKADKLTKEHERAANYCSDVLIGDLTPTDADELIRTERGT
jgi:hypothetical protein